MSLPESGLGPLTAQDHEDHHLTIHDILNRLLVDSSDEGDTLVKSSAGTGLATIGVAQPHFTFPDQVATHTHSVAGTLALFVTRQTKVIKATASADITGLSVSGLELVGVGFSQVWVRLEATAAIAVDLSGSIEVVGTPPLNLASGEVVIFNAQRWDT